MRTSNGAIDVAPVGVAPHQPVAGEPGQRVERGRLLHVELVREVLDGQHVLGRADPGQHLLTGAPVDVVVAGELEPAEAAAEVGERLAVAGRGRDDPADEDRVRATDDLLVDVALDVGEGVG